MLRKVGVVLALITLVSVVGAGTAVADPNDTFRGEDGESLTYAENSSRFDWNSTYEDWIQHTNPVPDDDGNVYVPTDNNGTLRKYDSSGSIVWESQLNASDSGYTTVKTQPVVDNGGDQVIVRYRYKNNISFVSFEQGSGSVLWRMTLPTTIPDSNVDQLGYMSADPLDDRVFTVDRNQTVYAINITDGTVAWNKTFSNSGVWSTGYATDDKVLVERSSNGNSGSGRLTAINRSDQTVAWNKTYNWYNGQYAYEIPGGSEDGEYVYLTQYQEVGAVFMKNGTLAWNTSTANVAGGHYYAVPTADGEGVLINDESTYSSWDENNLHRLDEDTGQIEWSWNATRKQSGFNTSGNLTINWGVPTVAEDGTIYFKNSLGVLYALNSSGNFQWGIHLREPGWDGSYYYQGPHTAVSMYGNKLYSFVQYNGTAGKSMLYQFDVGKDPAYGYNTASGNGVGYFNYQTQSQSGSSTPTPTPTSTSTPTPTEIGGGSSGAGTTATFTTLPLVGSVSQTSFFGIIAILALLIGGGGYYVYTNKDDLYT